MRITRRVEREARLNFIRFVKVDGLHWLASRFRRLLTGSPLTGSDVFFECNILRGKWRVTSRGLQGEGAGFTSKGIILFPPAGILLGSEIKVKKKLRLVEQKVIVEIKVAEAIAGEHKAQVII